MFALQKKEVADGGREWHVQMSTDSGRPTVGRFLIADGELRYQWAQGRDSDENAQKLRRLTLRLQSDSQLHYLSLRTPYMMDPITADFDRGVMRAVEDLGWWGQPEALFVEITSLDGEFPPYAFRDNKRTLKAADDTAVILFGEGDERTLAMTALATLTPKFSLTITPMFKVKTMGSPEEFTASNAQREGNKIKKQHQDATDSLATAKIREEQAASRSQKENLRARMEKLESEIAEYAESLEQMNNLSQVALRLQEKGKIHFRVFYKADDREIDFVRTEPAAEEATP
jgi:hypothetical protein